MKTTKKAEWVGTVSWVQVLSAVQFGFAFFRKSRFRGFRSLRSVKIAKWIGIFSKKSRDEKTGEIFRNLPFSLVFSCGSILTTQHGRGRRIRTRDPRFWRPVLYQLSYTPVQRQYYSTHPAKKQGVSRKIRKLFAYRLPNRIRKQAIGRGRSSGKYGRRILYRQKSELLSTDKSPDSVLVEIRGVEPLTS